MSLACLGLFLFLPFMVATDQTDPGGIDRAIASQSRTDRFTYYFDLAQYSKSIQLENNFDISVQIFNKHLEHDPIWSDCWHNVPITKKKLAINLKSIHTMVPKVADIISNDPNVRVEFQLCDSGSTCGVDSQGKCYQPQ